MNQAKKNFIQYCIQTVAYSVALMFLNGAIIQSFLLHVGLTEGQVYTYASITQVAQLLVMGLMIFLSGGIRRGRQISAFANLLMLLPLGLLVFGAIDTSIFSDTYVILLFILSFAAFGGIGMYAVLSYCLPFSLINIADYGKFTGIAGAVSGVVTFAISSLHSLIISNFDHAATMIWFFTLAAISVAVSAIMFFSMKELPREVNRSTAVGLSEILAVFKNRDTYTLLFPNLARGLALGVFNVVAVMAISTGVTDYAGASVINVIIQASSFAASLVFTFFYSKLGVENMLLYATIGVVVSLPFTLSFGFIPFLVIFLIAVFFRFIIDSAIPTALMLIIPENQMGAYSSIRMLVFTAGQAISAALVSPLVSLVGYTGVLIIAALMQLACGVGHYLVVKSHRKSK